MDASASWHKKLCTSFNDIGKALHCVEVSELPSLHLLQSLSNSSLLKPDKITSDFLSLTFAPAMAIGISNLLSELKIIPGEWKVLLSIQSHVDFKNKGSASLDGQWIWNNVSLEQQPGFNTPSFTPYLSK